MGWSHIKPTFPQIKQTTEFKCSNNKQNNKRAHVNLIYKSLNLLPINQILTLELQKNWLQTIS